MSLLWTTDAQGAWQAARLELDGDSLDRGRLTFVRCGANAASVSSSGVALLARPAYAVRINGEPLSLGVRVLRDRDEILVAAPHADELRDARNTDRVSLTAVDKGAPCEACSAQARRVFFSTERLAALESLPALGRAVYCGRCKQAILPGASAVRCPHCGVWHHQTTELPCWDFAERCSGCEQPTDLDAGYRWTPEGL